MRDINGRYTNMQKRVRKVTNWVVVGCLVYLSVLIGKDLFTAKVSAWFTPNYSVVQVYPPEAEMDYEELADKIFQLESSSGRNDGCKKQGLVNGYGYRQNTRSFKCYDNQVEVRNIVIGWFRNHLENGMDIATALCYYNTGHKVNDCNYYKNYQKL